MDPAHLVHTAASLPPQALGLYGSPTAVQRLYQDLSFCSGAQEFRTVAPGYSRGVNRAVLEAFGENLIPSLFLLDRLPHSSADGPCLQFPSQQRHLPVFDQLPSASLSTYKGAFVMTLPSRLSQGNFPSQGLWVSNCISPFATEPNIFTGSGNDRLFWGGSIPYPFPAVVFSLLEEFRATRGQESWWADSFSMGHRPPLPYSILHGMREEPCHNTHTSNSLGVPLGP